MIHGLIDHPTEAAGVVGIQAKANTFELSGQVGDQVVKATVLRTMRKTVDGSGHLGESAGFKLRRHEHEVGSSKCLMDKVSSKLRTAIRL